jgi:hypothetical protein
MWVFDQAEKHWVRLKMLGLSGGSEEMWLSG